MMKDTIGQKITLGDEVLWLRFYRCAILIYEVVKITPKRVHIREAGLPGGSHLYNSIVDPEKVVVITNNLEHLVE
jgi:hypothetical protein